MTDLMQLVEQLNKIFLDNTKLFDGISAESFDNGAFCLWFDASDCSHYVIHNWGEKPSKKEVIEMFIKWLTSLEERISNARSLVTDLFAEYLSSKIEVEDFSEAVNEITHNPFEGFQTPFGYDPFISPNPFGGQMIDNAPC